MPPEQYFADPCDVPSLTQSIAVTLVTQSEAHAYVRHPRLGGKSKQATAAMDEGSVIDALLLGNGKELFAIDADSFRTKAARELRDAARAEGKIPVLAKDADELLVTVAAIRCRLAEAGVDLAAGRSQVAAFWQEMADNGNIVQCRALLDHVDITRGVIRDLKKSRTAHPDALTKHVEGYGYDIQCAAYMNALGMCVPELIGRITFEWMFVEADAPYALSLSEPDGSMLALGNSRWRRAVNMWEAATRTGLWPCYEARGKTRLTASPWALEREMHAGGYDGESADV